ncbi:MAG: hemerythrin [Halieaceae bacterium]|jgi:hemerythrin
MRKTSEIIWQDTQHQVLFEILDLVGHAQAGGEILSKLQFYTENHFAIEEQYMTLMNYPHREAHVYAHDQFRREMEQMMENHESHDEIFMQIISTFLTEWLTRHVFGIDKKLEEFILASKIK